MDFPKQYLDSNSDPTATTASYTRKICLIAGETIELAVDLTLRC
jgi:hypothetical protein